MSEKIEREKERERNKCTDLIQSGPHLNCTDAILGGEQLGGEKSIQGKVCYRWAEVKGLLVLCSP